MCLLAFASNQTGSIALGWEICSGETRRFVIAEADWGRRSRGVSPSHKEENASDRRKNVEGSKSVGRRMRRRAWTHYPPGLWSDHANHSASSITCTGKMEEACDIATNSTTCVGKCTTSEKVLVTDRKPDPLADGAAPGGEYAILNSAQNEAETTVRPTQLPWKEEGLVSVPIGLKRSGYAGASAMSVVEAVERTP